MQRREFCALTGAGIVAGTLSVSEVTAAVAERPTTDKRNILVVLCDQLRPDFLEIYGCRAFATPNISRLADMGTTFDKAITASPVCAPARASMMTGRYPSDHQVWANDLPIRPGGGSDGGADAEEWLYDGGFWKTAPQSSGQCQRF